MKPTTWVNLTEEGRRSYGEMIAARMFNENAQDMSDEEIERTLVGCVSGNKLITLAKELRDSGEMTVAQIVRNLPGVAL